MKYSFLAFLFGIILATSCVNVKQISKGMLAENESYNFYFYNYINIGNNQNKLVKNCKVYLTHIKNEDKKIIEKIVWNSCDTVLPIKYFLVTDSVSGIANNLYLIADTSMNYLIPINKQEKEVFYSTNKYLAKMGYPIYDIKGFKLLTTENTPTRISFLKSLPKFNRN